MINDYCSWTENVQLQKTFFYLFEGFLNSGVSPCLFLEPTFINSFASSYLNASSVCKNILSHCNCLPSGESATPLNTKYIFLNKIDPWSTGVFFFVLNFYGGLIWRFWEAVIKWTSSLLHSSLSTLCQFLSLLFFKLNCSVNCRSC